MSSKAPNYCFALVRAFVLTLLVCSGINVWTTHAQKNIEGWAHAFDQRCTLDDLKAFEAEIPLAYGSMPGLNQSIPVLDHLETSLQPWGENRERENQCMQLLLEEQGKRLLQLAALHGLHSAVINAAWASTALPYSFRWIPALTSGWNQSAHSNHSRAGLWWNAKEQAPDNGTQLDGAIDERGVPATSTALAIAELEKLQRRFPNDPHRVLVAYLKGMAFATRWNGQPGYDKQLDEWLALYKVVSRMMVNTTLTDHQLDWVEVLSKWEKVTCAGKLSRNNFIEKSGLPAGVLTQFLPWWVGEELPCSALDSYEVALPEPHASRWNSVHVSDEAEPHSGLESAASIANKEYSSYTVAYTCKLHEVKSGDTLWNISKRHPGTTPEWIAEINEITDYIRIGEVLCIPIQP